MKTLYEKWLEFRAEMNIEVPELQAFTVRNTPDAVKTKPYKRPNKRRPELAGLVGREYHTAYVRLQRREDRRRV